jgi:hypothetical protein
MLSIVKVFHLIHFFDIKTVHYLGFTYQELLEQKEIQHYFNGVSKAKVIELNKDDPKKYIFFRNRQ